MARRIGHPVAAQARKEDGQPIAFTWRGVKYRVRVIGRWRLTARRWEPADAADRHYFRVITSDQQIIELYYEAAPTSGIPDNKRWVLDICQDCCPFLRALPAGASPWPLLAANGDVTLAVA